MNFLIQTMNSEVVNDFSFTLIESIKYQRWYYNTDINYTLSDTIIPDNKYIPIGDNEFVQKFIKEVYNRDVYPRNIPVELFGFAERTVINGTEKDIKGKKFVKSNDKIKLFTEITDTAPPGNYQISDIIDIDSEWRSFVFKKKLVGLQNYCGDFTIFPNVDTINKMIDTYKISPSAYTLDVGISGGKTVIIEVHDFFSCGLYGFSDHRILPQMFSSWFFNFIQ